MLPQDGCVWAGWSPETLTGTSDQAAGGVTGVATVLQLFK